MIDGLADRLRQAGVREAFGVTGSGVSWELISALERLGIIYYPAAHEAAAALMAGAVARLEQRLSPAIGIKGPGLANMLPGIVANHYENAPALTLAEAYAKDAPAWRRHKRLDQDALLRPLVKRHLSADRVEHGWAALERAALAEAPGPVHVDLAGTDRDAGPDTVSVPAASDRDAVLKLVAAAQRPVVVAGSLALRRAWRARLEQLRVPVFTTAAGKGAIDERLAHAAGVLTGDGRALSPEARLLPHADLVIGVGLRNTEVLTGRGLLARGVLIDECAGFAAGLEPQATWLAGSDALPQVLDALAHRAWGDDLIAEARRALRADDALAGWLPLACFSALDRQAFDYGLVLDTGSFCTVGEHAWSATPSRPFLGSSNGRYMGVGIPTAIGMAVARPGLPVFAIVGDGGIGMYVSEVRLAVQERLPLCTVLMRDGVYGSIAAAAGAEPRSARAVRPPGDGWCEAFQAMGCPAERVHDEAQFDAALSRWDRRTPHLVEAVFEPERYRVMTRNLR